jgi:hypothetical protein
LVIGPNWRGKLPAGFVGANIVQSPSDFAGVAARLALTDDTDEELKAVNAIQTASPSCRSASGWPPAGRT